MQTHVHSLLDFLPRARNAIVGLALSAVLAGPAFAIVFQDPQAQSEGLGAGQAFLNGEAALRMTFSDGSHPGCSGSLVGGGAFVLTAAHCLTDGKGNKEATSIDMFFAGSNLDVTSTHYLINPNWVGTISGGGDLALIKLNAPILSIPSYQLDTKSTAVGDIVTLAGYGETGVGDTGEQRSTFGTLHYGRNRFDFPYDDVPWVYEYDFDKLGDDSLNVTGGLAVGSDEVDIGAGDSGGGALMFVNGAWELVGVHEFTICAVDDCGPISAFGEKGGDTSVFAYRTWLDQELGAAAAATPVPEAKSWALLTMGFVALGLMSRRRSTSSAHRTALRGAVASGAFTRALSP
jgi:secreted trypsin-like serine protease